MPDLFNTGFSNNAPPPIPGGYGNPTGTNTGAIKSNASVPSSIFAPFPVTGSPSLPGGITPGASSANGGLFTATNIGGLSSGLGSLSSPFGNFGNNFLHELTDAYGKGTGTLLDNILTKGLFNPQVAAAFLNALQPGINRGESDILQAFGAEGSRFGSSASVGLGDYLSQTGLNEQQTLASLYEQSIGQELSLLTDTLPQLATSQANRESGGPLSIIAGLLSGGVLGPALNGLNKAINTHSVAPAPASTSAGSTGPGAPLEGGGIGGPNLSGVDPSTLLSTSAGASLGGSDPFGSSGGSSDLASLLALGAF